MKWEKYFKEEQIDKGFDYYMDDEVHNVKIGYNSIKSTVDKEDVKIIFDKNDIKSMDCTCPHSYSDNCKHMIATLYVYDDMLNDLSVDYNYDDVNSKVELISALDTMDERLLKDYIIKKFGEDTKFIEEFLNNFQPKISPKTFQKYKEILNDAFDIELLEACLTYSYKKGSINLLLHEFIENKISALYRNNQYEYILILIKIIYEKIAILEDANDYIDIPNVLSECNTYMAYIIDSQDTKAKDETYNYFMKNLKYKYNKYTASHILSLCLMCYTDKTYQKRTLTAINNIINENNDIPLEVFEIKCELMIDLDYLYEDIKEELFEYKESSIIRDRLVEAAIKEKKYDDAILLLEECSESWDDRNPLKDINTLLDLYMKVGNKKKCKENIKNILYEYNVQDIKYVEQLKELCSENEWTKELRKLEQYYKETYDEDFINEIHKKYHEDTSKNKQDNNKIDYYREKIFEENKTARSRKAYDRIIGYMDVMLTYDDGREEVQKIIDTLKNDKNNRGKHLFIEKLKRFENTMD